MTRGRPDRPRLPPARHRRTAGAAPDAPWRAIIRRTRRDRRRLAMLASHAELPPGSAVVFAVDGREPTRDELMSLTPSPYRTRHEAD